MGLLSTIGAASGRAFGLTRLSAAIKDTYFNLVTLLLPGNGTNGAQNNTFLDSSSNNFTITRNGNTTQGTFSPFSQTGWSNYFDGTGDYLTGTITAVNNTTMTMECWVWFVAFDNTDGDHIVQVNNGTNSNYALIHNTNGSARFLSRNNTGGAIFDISSANSILQANKWHHIVGVRNASAASLYVDGTRVATVSSPSVSSTDGTSFQIAYNAAASPREPNAYISNVRIVSGTAVYDPTSSSLTVPTSPLTAVSGTRILTCESNRFVDNSGNNVALTITGTPSVQAFSPFAPTAAYSAATNGGSAYLDGTGDFLTLTQSALVTGANTDFTLEAWVYCTKTAAYQGIVSTVDSTDTDGFRLGIDNSNRAEFIFDALPSVLSTKFQMNAWNHMAMVRSGTASNNISCYLNGERVGQLTDNDSTVNTTLAIGRYRYNADANYLQGYVSGVKYVVGTASYSGATITVPTAPPSPTGSTLCLNFTNAGITDATAKNVLETVGNAQISTTQSKFGGSSMLFDGNDALVIPYKELLDLKTTFTIEAWIYPTNVTAGYRGIYTINATSGANYGTLALYHDGTTLGFELRPTSGGGITAITGGTLSANTWHHVAFSMSSLSGRLFLNGTQVGSTTTFTDYSFTVVGVAAGNIGNNPTSTQGFVGYIDDLRITRGRARYTANFTAPSSAFELQ